MLSPDQGCLYTDALRPPAGFRFSEAVAATYSLDLETLLTIPLHLALFSSEQPVEDLLKDGVGLLEALRRTTHRITVFAESGRVLAPRAPHALFSMLEPTVVEALPPSDSGSFHPKLWLVRFDHPESEETRLRLLVLSRNLTADRCWDLILSLEGRPGGRRMAGNDALAGLVAALPGMARHPLEEVRASHVHELAELARRTEWQLPGEFEDVRFHALGLRGRGGWLPDASERMAVISPFLSPRALEALLGTTGDPVALISRPEELAQLPSAVLAGFRRALVLAEQAELEDGEEADAPRDPRLPTQGLHAKAYVTEAGGRTHLYVGSANASSQALVRGANVELMAELEGRTSRVGGVEALLGPGGFVDVLSDYVPGDEAEDPDAEAERLRELLEDARRTLSRAPLVVRFHRHQGLAGRDGGGAHAVPSGGALAGRDGGIPLAGREGGGWGMELVPEGPLDLPGVRDIRAWLVTRQPEGAVSVAALRDGSPAALPGASLSLLTSFVAFQLEAGEEGGGREAQPEGQPEAHSVRFVLRLPAKGLPVEERDAAIIRDVIRNRDGFLRYVMLLLAEAGEDGAVFGAGAGSWGQSSARNGSSGDLPLFEHLTRAFCREPERLDAIRKLIAQVGTGGNGSVVPAEFLDLWAVFEAAVRVGSDEGEADRRDVGQDEAAATDPAPADPEAPR